MFSFKSTFPGTGLFCSVVWSMNLHSTHSLPHTQTMSFICLIYCVRTYVCACDVLITSLSSYYPVSWIQRGERITSVSLNSATLTIVASPEYWFSTVHTGPVSIHQTLSPCCGCGPQDNGDRRVYKATYLYMNSSSPLTQDVMFLWCYWPWSTCSYGEGGSCSYVHPCSYVDIPTTYPLNHNMYRHSLQEAQGIAHCVHSYIHTYILYIRV